MNGFSLRIRTGQEAFPVRQNPAIWQDTASTVPETLEQSLQIVRREIETRAAPEVSPADDARPNAAANQAELKQISMSPRDDRARAFSSLRA